MTERKPELFGVAVAHELSPKKVALGIVYNGLKNSPADRMLYTPEEARTLATRILLAAEQAEGRRVW